MSSIAWGIVDSARRGGALAPPLDTAATLDRLALPPRDDFRPGRMLQERMLYRRTAKLLGFARCVATLLYVHSLGLLESISAIAPTIPSCCAPQKDRSRGQKIVVRWPSRRVHAFAMRARETAPCKHGRKRSDTTGVPGTPGRRVLPAETGRWAKGVVCCYGRGPTAAVVSKPKTKMCTSQTARRATTALEVPG